MFGSKNSLGTVRLVVEPENVDAQRLLRESWRRHGGGLHDDDLVADDFNRGTRYRLRHGFPSDHASSPNRAALPLLPPEIRRNPAIFPPEDVLARSELIEDLGETTVLYDRLWTEVKTSR